MLIALLGLAPILRFLWFWATGDGDGHVQSLVIGGSLLILGSLVAILGVLADLVSANRKLLEINLTELRELRDRIDRQEPAAEASEQPEKPSPLARKAS